MPAFAAAEPSVTDRTEDAVLDPEVLAEPVGEILERDAEAAAPPAR